MSVGVIIAAAGTGSRMGTKEKKQFLELDGIAILKRTVEHFEIEAIDEIVVVTGSDDMSRVRELLGDHIKVVTGGDRRQDSIMNGLKHIHSDYVLIHDGARPFIDKKLILEHIDRLKKDDALITCVKTKDTIKVMKGDVVDKTLNRALLVNVQTPQSFQTDLLKEAYKRMVKENWTVTDDASLIELMGKPVKTIEGSYNNIKITTIEDLALAEFILKGLK